jgi:predicted metal-dependent HD superfamily phosphohydrolase
VGYGKDQFSFEDCPCCNDWSVRTTDGKFVRHLAGIGSIDYRYVHTHAKFMIAKFNDKRPEREIVKEYVKDNLCLSSGRTIEDAKRIGAIKRQWDDLMLRLQARPKLREFRNLYDMYAGREYHNLDHVMACLSELKDAKTTAENPNAVEFALWFHDAVYDTHRNDNEERSAALAREVAERLGLDKKFILAVSWLIFATSHFGTPINNDMRLICDVDLAIMGADTRTFNAYDTAVRKEYSWVKDTEYTAARTKLLSALASRPRIFLTNHFMEKYEETARANLARVLATPTE